MNVSYVRQYHADGTLKNAIAGEYLHHGPNRQERREELRRSGFMVRVKNVHLTVLPTGKYRRFRQVIHCRHPKTKVPTGEVRVIEHYGKC